MMMKLIKNSELTNFYLEKLQVIQDMKFLITLFLDINQDIIEFIGKV